VQGNLDNSVAALRFLDGPFLKGFAEREPTNQDGLIYRFALGQSMAMSELFFGDF
jgi:hypothetical protein